MPNSILALKLGWNINIVVFFCAISILLLIMDILERWAEWLVSALPDTKCCDIGTVANNFFQEKEMGATFDKLAHNWISMIYTSKSYNF